MIKIKSELEMKQFGVKLGELLEGGEVIELIGDVGAGKTTMTRGIADGLGVYEIVQSPSFTISRVYDARDDLRLVHYDFYRLKDPGVMADALDEAMSETNLVTVIEWSDGVKDILNKDRLTIEITPTDENSREIIITAGGGSSEQLLDKIHDFAD